MEIILINGKLSLYIKKNKQLLSKYFIFASRNNKKRGYYFLSKILGKNFPTTPSKLLAIHEKLAKLIDIEKNEIIQVIGFAEAATGLGFGVFEALLRMKIVNEIIYTHSTRHKSNDKILTFEESHSHAPYHQINYPSCEKYKKIQNIATSLVLVDDEISTGNTYKNFIIEYIKKFPKIKKIIIITLIDLSDGKAKDFLIQNCNISVDVKSIISGSFIFENNNSNYFKNINELTYSETQNFTHLNHNIWTNKKLVIDQQNIEFIIKKYHLAKKTILILGTGEFMHPCFILGLKLELLGFNVKLQSITRSPILLGDGVQEKIQLPSLYQENIEYFIYNLNREKYSTVFICYDTPRNKNTEIISEIINGISLYFIYCINENKYKINYDDNI